MSDILKRTQEIVRLLNEKKAEDIIYIDMQDKPYITKYVVIATAMIGRHAYALLDMLRSELKKRGEQFYGIDEESEDWIIIDLGDIMIHIFTQDYRRKFNLEEFLKKDLMSTSG